MLSAVVLLFGCGSRADYEVAWFRELVRRGESEAALEQYDRLPADLRETVEVRELRLAALLGRLHLPDLAIATALPAMLGDLPGTYRRLRPSQTSEADLRAIGELALAGAGGAPGERRSFVAMNAAIGLYAGMSLCRMGAEGGAELCVRSLEYVAGGSARARSDRAREARGLLDALDEGEGGREEALEAMLGVGR